MSLAMLSLLHVAAPAAASVCVDQVAPLTGSGANSCWLVHVATPDLDTAYRAQADADADGSKKLSVCFDDIGAFVSGTTTVARPGERIYSIEGHNGEYVITSIDVAPFTGVQLDGRNATNTIVACSKEVTVSLDLAPVKSTPASIHVAAPPVHPKWWFGMALGSALMLASSAGIFLNVTGRGAQRRLLSAELVGRSDELFAMADSLIENRRIIQLYLSEIVETAVNSVGKSTCQECSNNRKNARTTASESIDTFLGERLTRQVDSLREIASAMRSPTGGQWWSLHPNAGLAIMDGIGLVVFVVSMCLS